MRFFSAVVSSFEQNSNKTFRYSTPVWKNVQSLLSYQKNKHLATDRLGFVWIRCDSLINNSANIAKCFFLHYRTAVLAQGLSPLISSCFFVSHRWIVILISYS